jgi:mono/diheme cytochrome c family protein
MEQVGSPLDYRNNTTRRSRALRAVSLAAAACALLPFNAASYSETQASHGDALYRTKCQACHGASFEGGDEAPALKGDMFWSGWDKQTARALYARILTSMPPDSPGSLDEKDVIDIVACLLKANGITGGDKPIVKADELNGIRLSRP